MECRFATAGGVVSRRFGSLGGALGWLGLQLLEQDQRPLADRDLERRETAADAIVRSLERTLAALDGALERRSAPEGSVFIRRDAAQTIIQPSSRILWLPIAPHRDDENTEAFEEAEAAEF